MTTAPTSTELGSRRDRGAVIPLTGLLLTVLMLSVAFAVDLGRLTAERRDKQADADVIALDLVRLADGRTTAEILASADYATTLNRAASANGIADPLGDLVVTYGIFDAQTDTFVAAASTDVPNAVRVEASSTIDYLFAQAVGFSQGSTSRPGTAALDPVADLSIGSKLAEMRAGDADRLNFLLKNRLGGADFTFTGASYQGLAATTLTYEDISVAAGFGSPDQFLDAELTLGDFAQAAADAFKANGEASNVSIALELADRSRKRELELDRPKKTFRVRDILQVSVGGPPEWASATANFFDLFVAATEVVNGNNFTDVCTAVPGWNDGFADVPRDTLDFEPADEILNPSASTCTSVIEPPQWITNGRPGASASTAQMRADQTGEGDIDISGLTGRAIVPAAITAAGAQADLSAIRCNRATGDHRTDTFVTPQPMTVQIGTPGSEFKLADALGLVVVAVDIDKALTPSSDAGQLIADQAIDTVQRGPGTTPTFGFRLTASDVNVVVETGILPLSMADFLDLLVPRLNVLLSQLDHRSTRYLEAFGIGVGGSDLLLDDVRCDRPLLVD
jgi:uncharacterized membrane protein